jgi:Tn3 transposase DDE domain
VKLNKDNTLTISTPKVDDADAAPLQTFFPARDYISLLEVLSTVNRYSGFLDEFQHWQQRYHRPKPPQKTFYAGIIGLGCGIGTRKIARISRQISEPELENTVNWYFSPDATQERGCQAQVARALGVNRRRLYDWFSGRISPTLAVGLRIQAFLKLHKGPAK